MAHPPSGRVVLLALLLTVVLAVCVSLARPVEHVAFGGAPVHAWLELDAPPAPLPSVIFLSIKIWRLRFNLEWSMAERSTGSDSESPLS